MTCRSRGDDGLAAQRNVSQDQGEQAFQSPFFSRRHCISLGAGVQARAHRSFTGRKFPPRIYDASAASARIATHPPRFDAVTRTRTDHARRLCQKTVPLLPGRAARSRKGARAGRLRHAELLTLTTCVNAENATWELAGSGLFCCRTLLAACRGNVCPCDGFDGFESAF